MKIPKSLDRFKLSFREMVFVGIVIAGVISSWYKLNTEIMVLKVNTEVLQCQILELTDFQTKGVEPAGKCWQVAVDAFKKGNTDFLVN